MCRSLGHRGPSSASPFAPVPLLFLFVEGKVDGRVAAVGGRVVAGICLIRTFTLENVTDPPGGDTSSSLMGILFAL